MNNNEGRERFEIRLDTAQLMADSRKAESAFKSISDKAVAEGGRIDNAFRTVGAGIAGYFTVGAIKDFTKQVVSLRGEIQSLEISFQTLAGKTKGDALFKDIREFAVQTPMMLKDLASGAQTMLAFNIEAEKVMPILKAIGDISMGDAQKFNSLTLAFSQMSATGKLMGQDLLQMINAGFNPLATISEKTGKSIGDLKEDMEKGKITTEKVTEAFMAAASEGGKFNGMLEKQSKGINGAISNLQGAIDDMMNAIGTSMESSTVSLISWGTSLAKNYEQVGRILASLIATYGTYKAAMATLTAVEALRTAGIGAMTASEAIHYGWLVAVEKAQKLLNATMLSNPYILAATALAALVGVMVSMKNETERLKEAEDAYNAAKQETIEKEQKHKQKVDELIGIAENEALSTDTRRLALVKLENRYQSIFKKYKTEADLLTHIKEIKEEIAALDGQASITSPKNELQTVEDRIKKLEAKAQTVRYVSQNTSAGVISRQVGGLSDSERTELKMLQNKRDELNKQVKKDDADAFFANLTGVSNDTLAQMIKTREELLAKMKLSKTDKGTIKASGVTGGTFSKEEIEAQLQELKRQQTERAADTKSGKEWVNEKKKAYDKAKKAYEDYVNGVTSKNVKKDDFEKEAKRLKAEMETAEKAYKNVGGKTDKQEESEENKAERIRKQTEKYQRLMDTAALEEKRAREDMENQVEQAGINAEKNAAKKTRRQMELDFEMEMQQIDRQKEDALIKKIETAREIWETNPENKGKAFDGSGIALTDEEMQQYNNLYKATIDKNLKLIEDQEKVEREAMQNFLVEYGTYLQKRQALTEQYQDKIAKASTEGDKKTLQKQLEKALSDLDIENLKTSINWEGLFGNLSNLTKKELSNLKKQLDDFKKSGKFELMTPENKKVILDAYNKLSEQMNTNGGLFGELVNATKDYNLALQELKDAQQKYNEALASGVAEDIEEAKKRLNNAQADATNKRTQKTNATDVTTKKLTALAGVITDLGNASELSLASLGSLVETATSAFSEAAGKVGGIIGTVLNVLDSIGNQDIGQWAKGIVDKVFDSVGNVLDSSYSPLHYLTGGWLGSSDKSLEKDIETLTASNEALKESINRLAERMADAATSEAESIYEEQLKYLKESMSNTQQMMKRSAADSTSGVFGVGSKASSNHEINKAMTKAEWQRISTIVGKNVSTAKEFFNLSSEQMALVANNAADIYNKIKKYADDGYKNAAQYMDEYIAYYEQIEELQDALNEKLTSTDFDSVRDEFKSALLDMESDTEDFAEAFEDMMEEAVVESLMSSKYDKLIKLWYEEFASAMKDDGTLTSDEQSKLKSSWDDIVNQAVNERNALIEAMGWESSSSRTGTSGSGIAASQESVSELNGRATVIQGHTYSISENMKVLVSLSAAALEKLSGIEQNTAQTNDRLDTMNSNMKRLRDTVDDISTRGVRIKT